MYALFIYIGGKSNKTKYEAYSFFVRNKAKSIIFHKYCLLKPVWSGVAEVSFSLSREYDTVVILQNIMVVRQHSVQFVGVVTFLLTM